MKPTDFLQKLLFALVLLPLPVLAETYEEAYQKAEKALQANQWQQAEKIWQQMTARFPTDLRVQNNLAVLEMRNQHYEAAQQRLEKLLSQQAEFGVAYKNLNQLYAYEAQKAYRKVFEKTKVVQPKGELMSLPKEFNITDIELELERIFNAQKQVLNALETWRLSWSAQDVAAYLQAYEKNFRPDNGATTKSWKANRKGSLTRPEFIKIGLEDVSVLPIDDQMMRVSFMQAYQSDRFNDKVKKVLFFRLNEKENVPTWKIHKETVVYAQ